MHPNIRVYYTPDPEKLEEKMPAAMQAGTAPVIDGGGELRGVLGGMFRLGSTSVSSFYGSITKLRIGESGAAYLVDSSGRILYHTDPERIDTDATSEPVVQQALTRAVGDARIQDSRGREVLASYAPVPETPWSLVTEEDWGALMSSSQGYRQSLLLLFGLGTIVPALVVTFGVRRMTGCASSPRPS